MLGKFYAEAFENADPAPREALPSTGASWLQTIRFGAPTQVAPDLARDTLFRSELDLRESSAATEQLSVWIRRRLR
jgi:phosphonate transport system permease protein